MTTLDTAVLPVAAPLKPRASLAQLVQREGRRRRKRRILFWLALAALPLVVIGVWAALRPRPVPLAQRFRIQAVARGDVVREVHATGHLEAVTTVQVGAEISGRIATVLVDYNDDVKAGQVLARFDRASLQAQLAQTRATLAAARAALAQARTDRDQNARNLARAQALYAQRTLSESDHETAVATARLAEQRVEAAAAQVDAQEAAYSLARTSLDHSIIKAPIDGVVITRNVDPGQTVASALQTPILFTVAADLKKMRVIAAVDEADIGEVLAGQHATFTVNAYGDRTFDGLVTEVRNSAVVVQDVVTYGTVIEVANPDLALKPGMTASVRIRAAAATNVLHVPNAALHFTPPGEPSGAGPGLWVLEGTTLQRVEVRPGITDGEATEIAEGPLPPGAPVLVELSPEGRKTYGANH